jgi:Lon protease-like protein
MRNNRIPLFPLNVVLFPGASLPLHIFEPRYRLMIRHCTSQRLEFGIILAQESGVATTGCTAQIVRTIREYPTGEADIFTEGRAVFRALDLLSEKEYHEAIVEYLSDTPEETESQKEDSLIGMFQRCHSLTYRQLWSPSPKDSIWPLSYRMASQLPLELDEKQALLELRAEPARQEFLRVWLNGVLPRLEQQERGRHRAGSNGHSVN